ncbi:hypothetical protein JTE90_017415 [Oedothorax gibbosus]|uniref:Calx-beta domain-containing protein n=1 Tax=Oedothorax gibbosus TaxID=931172 RepID=A0AAV6U7P2_9ARAC|nr:hypothetical protein JTE90_017415 [Oedothorax gibbosus]
MFFPDRPQQKFGTLRAAKDSKCGFPRKSQWPTSSDCLQRAFIRVWLLGWVLAKWSCHLPPIDSTRRRMNSSCVDGLLLWAWQPTANLSRGDVVARGLVYFAALVYVFVGVSIVADRFMGAIEVITAREREVVVRRPDGTTRTTSVRVWNETVSNLTLMALGSSAPEILLSVIEVIGSRFEAGELGPGTIVGSAAFNMFVIVAICVGAVPCAETRRIKHLRVFFVTMTWSVFAYVWLYVILAVSSYGVIEVWEAAVTFLFFPATVLTAYAADRRFLVGRCLRRKEYRANRRGVIVGGEAREEEGAPPEEGARQQERAEEEETFGREEEQRRGGYVRLLRELRRTHPDAPMAELEERARTRILEEEPKSRAFYRLQATRRLTGNLGLHRGRGAAPDQEAPAHPGEAQQQEAAEERCVLSFQPAHYTVLESVGRFAVGVERSAPLGRAVCVDFSTEDGTAEAGSDYEPLQGTLVFRPGEARQLVWLTIVDDDVFEEDEHFFVRLSSPRYADALPDGIPPDPPLIVDAEAGTATVVILDDDHGGVFGFEAEEAEVPECCDAFPAHVLRRSGARGRVLLPFRTRGEEGGALRGRDYTHVEGVLVFENNENRKDIPIPIVDHESYERDAVFYLELGEPKTEEGVGVGMTEAERQVALLGRPRLDEERSTLRLRIKESKEFKSTVDALFEKKGGAAVGTCSWREQLLEVITVSAGEEDGGGMPSWSDYVMHFFTIFWKALFAFVPPTDCLGGWACFVTSIVVIGLLTALVGDLASHFGCTVGLKDSVTAISFVALGTSVPDTFASKVAALNDKYADSSIGNVTGSNAVNVFLGIGIAWSIAALHHAARGRQFLVAPGALAFSVTMYCACAFVCAAVLMARRSLAGGELGGPMRFKAPTVALFVSLWLFYVLMSSLEAYDIIEGF